MEAETMKANSEVIVDRHSIELGDLPFSQICEANYYNDEDWKTIYVKMMDYYGKKTRKIIICDEQKEAKALLLGVTYIGRICDDKILFPYLTKRKNGWGINTEKISDDGSNFYGALQEALKVINPYVAGLKDTLSREIVLYVEENPKEESSIVVNPSIEDGINTECLGQYDAVDKSITLFSNNILSISECVEFKDIPLYTLIAFVLVHEIEHVRQELRFYDRLSSPFDDYKNDNNNQLDGLEAFAEKAADDFLKPQPADDSLNTPQLPPEFKGSRLSEIWREMRKNQKGLQKYACIKINNESKMYYDLKESDFDEWTKTLEKLPKKN